MATPNGAHLWMPADVIHHDQNCRDADVGRHDMLMTAGVQGSRCLIVYSKLV